MTKRAVHPSITALLILLSVMVSLAGCAPHAERDRLRRAEALMESDARAARALLDSIDASTLGGRDRADHAWLTVQADYKNYVPLTTDSLALVATAYYGTPRLKSYRAAMAWYTLGCCYTDMSRPEEAFGAYLKARHCFPTTQNRYYSLCEQNIGKCYLDRCLYDDAIESFTHSRDVSVAIGDSTQIAWCDYYLGRCHLYLMNYEKAKESFLSVEANPRAPSLAKNNLSFYLAKIAFYYEKDIPKATEMALRNLALTNDITESGSTFLFIGDIYAEQQQLDSASYYYSLALQQPNDLYTQSILSYRQLKTCLQANDSLVTLLKSYVELNDELHDTRNHAEIDSQRENYERLLNKQKARLQSYLLLGLCVAICSAVIIWSLSHANRRKKAYIRVMDGLKTARMDEERHRMQLARLSQDAEQLRSQNQSANQRISELESIIRKEEKSLYEDVSSSSVNLRALELSEYKDRMDICARQFKESDSWKLALGFIHGSEHFLRREEREAIKHDLNVCFTDFYEILSAEGQKIIQTEKMVAACYYLGLKVEEAEEMLGLSDSTIRVQKHRLKEKVPSDLFSMLFPSSANK